MMPTSKLTQAPSESAAAPSTVQSLGSVLLFAHLFFVVIALAGNLAPSGLERRLLTVFRPYVRLLNFDVTYQPFYLTHAAAADAQHRLEYLPADGDAQNGDDWRRLNAGVRGSDRSARYERLAQLLAALGEADDGSQAAEVASAVGTSIWRQGGQPISQLRSRRQLLQGPEDLTDANPARHDPYDASYFQDVYRAQVVDLGGDRLGVQKIEARGQVAPSISGRKRSGTGPKDSGTPAKGSRP